MLGIEILIYVTAKRSKTLFTFSFANLWTGTAINSSFDNINSMTLYNSMNDELFYANMGMQVDIYLWVYVNKSYWSSLYQSI